LIIVDDRKYQAGEKFGNRGAREKKGEKKKNLLIVGERRRKILGGRRAKKRGERGGFFHLSHVSSCQNMSQTGLGGTKGRREGREEKEKGRGDVSQSN